MSPTAVDSLLIHRSHLSPRGRTTFPLVRGRMVGLGGLEPPTSSLSAIEGSPLYGPPFFQVAADRKRRSVMRSYCPSLQAGRLRVPPRNRRRGGARCCPGPGCRRRLPGHDQDRPHRLGLAPEAAAAALAEQARGGRLDPECVRVVVEAAGRPSPRVRTAWPPAFPSGRSRSCAWSPVGCRIVRSPSACTSRPVPPSTTCSTSTPRSVPRPGLPRLCSPWGTACSATEPRMGEPTDAPGLASAHPWLA